MPTFSIKSYLIAALAVVLLSGFVWYTFHERHVEHAKDVAVATKVVAAVSKQDTVIAAKAGTEVSNASQVYKQTLQLSPLPPVGIVCEPTGGYAVPGPAPAGPDADAPTARAIGPRFDPSGQALTVGRDADAQVAALQKVVLAMRAEMAAAAKVHR